VPGDLAVLALPASHRRRQLTVDMLERLNEVPRRWTRVSGLFSEEASAPSPVNAAAMEIDDGRETGRKDLAMGTG
jgi:transposase-like protein